MPHVAEAKWADVAVVMPATSNSVGKLAAGLSDSYPLLVIRAVPRTKKVIVVPSMNPEMWFDPQFQRNVDLLNATEKYQVISPSRGQMASGDFGFGAQAPFEDIVAETYRAIGIDQAVERALSPFPRPPGSLELVDLNEGDPATILIVDADESLRNDIAKRLQILYSTHKVHQFESASQASDWLKHNRASVVLTEIVFPDGISGLDLIEFCRQSGSRECSIIATSTKERRAIGAERLARQDVQFLPKPLNIPFTVGMIAGCLQTTRHLLTQLMNLAKGETLFQEGDIGEQVFLVESGTLKVTKIRGDRETVVKLISAGEMIGEMAFIDGAKRSATVVALEPCKLMAIQLDEFRDYLDRQPVWLNKLLETLSMRLRETTDQVAANSELVGRGDRR